jgi:hypothetical protein
LDYYQGPLFQGKKVLLDQLLYKYDVTGSETTVLYRIDALKKIKTYPVIFSDNSYHFDTELAYELLSMFDLAFVFQVLSYTRRHDKTFTSQISYRFRTSLNLREDALFKYKSLDPILEKEYGKVRSLYGYYLFNQWIKGEKKCLEWHRTHLPADRRFKPGETSIAVFSTLISKIYRLLIKVLKREKVST